MGQALRRFSGQDSTTWTFPDAIAEIDRLGNTLKRGWDGHGASEIGFTARTNAVDFVRRVWKDYGTVVQAPAVAPVSDGGIALEWIVRTPQGARELELVFLDRGNEYSVRYQGKSAFEHEGEDESVPFLLSL